MKDIKLKLISILLCSTISIKTEADIVVDGLQYSLEGTKATITDYIGFDENLVIPETITYNGSTYTVTSIGYRPGTGWMKYGAFYYCSTLKSVVIPPTITSINGVGDNDFIGQGNNGDVFFQCSNLEFVHFKGAIDIGKGAFYNCNKLRCIQFDDRATIGVSCFYKCSSLTYLVLPAGTIVKSNAFYGCNLIQNIICLGDSRINVNLNNVNYYTRNDLIHWDTYSYDYTGEAPPLSTFTYNLPNGFKPTSVVEEGLTQISAGNFERYPLFTFSNGDMSFNVEIPYYGYINPVKLTAKVKDASRLYGDANPQFNSVYTGFVNNEDARVIESHGNYTTATETSDVGTYAIKQSGALAQNYVFEYEDGTLTVNKAPLTMTANDKSMIYGGKVPTLDARYEGLKNGEKQPTWNHEPTLTTTANPTSKVGTYPITISNADAKNYQLTINKGTMTIDKAELTVRAENKSRTYGDANPQFTLTYTGLKNNETVPEWAKVPTIETTASMQSSVGTYPISIKDGIAVNYNISAVDGTLTVNKAALQIIPKDITRKYGEENPKFELSYVGLKNNENTPEWIEAPVVSSKATKTSPVGEYAIQVASANARNYTLEKKNGTLTITKAPLTISVKSYTRKYGEANPNFGLNYTGLLNGETAPAWTEMPTINTEATKTSDVGEYAITATGGVMKNYETSGIAPGTLTITPVSLLIKANNASRLYYEGNPSFSYTCTGLVGNDNESVLTVKPQMRTNATQNSKVGVYPIEIDGAEAKNYMLSYEKGQLTINKRQLTVSTKDYTRAYGEENPAFELYYKGFVNNEDESVFISKPKATTEATSDTDTGIYDITVSNGVAENYEFLYIGGKLTIEKAYQTLKWEQDFSDIKQYDQVELTATASSGLDVTYTVEGEQIGSIYQIGKKQYLDCNGTGEAVIVAIQEGNKNYWQTTKIYKPIVIVSTSIENLTNIDTDGTTKIYDAKGNRLGKLQRGINIIQKEDGTIRKIIVK
ncbi:MAG: leucine-rich repeat protein [Paludibacteraceae bacterium]|nr:leucine-rich repeat protein [Paludibacteraceae bacterium]